MITMVSGILSLVMLLYFILQSKKSALIHSFIGLILLAFIWSTGKLVEFFALNAGTQWISFQLMYTAIDFGGIACLIFGFFYTNRQFIHNRRNIVLLLIPSFVIHIAFLTDNRYHLFFKELSYRHIVPGLFFGISVVWIFGNIIMLFILLTKFSRGQNQYVKRQVKLLSTALAAPFFVGFLTVLDLDYYGRILPFKDLAAPTFTVTIILFAIAIFKYKFLNIVSIAFRDIIHNLKESLVLVDNTNIILDYNFSFPHMLPECQRIKTYDNIAQLTAMLHAKLPNHPESARVLADIANPLTIHAIGELNIGARNFFINIQPIINKHHTIGRIISFQDTTDYKNMLEELLIAKERNRLAHDIHDSVGHTMTVLLTSLEGLSVHCRDHPGQIGPKLAEIIQMTRDGLQELKYSLQGLTMGELKVERIASTLQYLISESQFSGLKVDMTIEGKDELCPPQCSNVIYRACQESLTNSLRHGKATEVDIVLRFGDDGIKLFIMDDGIGCREIRPGFGLKGMAERVAALHGKFVYGSDGEKGFNLYLELPAKIPDERNGHD
jgi:signal transduction histidine kinase